MPKIINKQKAPKDILLNSILEEIDHENGIVNKLEEPIVAHKPKKNSKKKKEQHPLLRVLFYFLSTMIVIFLMFMIVMITLTEESTQEKKSKKSMPKKQYHFEDLSKSTLKEEGNTIVGIMQKKVQVKNTKNQEGQEAKKNIRKTAKEILLEQMQN